MRQKYPKVAANWHYIDSIPLFFRERIIMAATTPFKPFQDLLLIDEGYVVFESRESMTPFVSLMTRLIFLSRKLGFELFVSAQLSSSLDKRVRFLAEEWILAEKKILLDGSQEFLYHRWIVHAVSTELKKIPSVEIPWDWALQLFQCYQSTKISDTELDSTLGELNALFVNTSPQERIQKEHQMEDELLKVRLVRYLATHQMQPHAVQDLGKLKEFADSDLKAIRAALTWLAENRLVMRAGTARGIQRYEISR